MVREGQTVKRKEWIVGASAECFLPTALVSLSKTAEMAHEAGFDAIEVAPFWGGVFGNRQDLAVPILSAHGHWNPVSAREKIRQGGIKGLGPIFIDITLFPPVSLCERFLRGLASEGIPVNTCFIADLLRQKNIYSEFQPHPDLGLNLAAVVELLRITGTKAVYDTCHMRRSQKPQADGGQSPLGDWRQSWNILNSQDLIGSVHVQYFGLDELVGMLRGDDTIEIAKMLRVIGASYEGLITLEISPINMVQLRGWNALLPAVQVNYLSQLREFVGRQLYAGLGMD